ncbi:RNA-guided endonuclease InsQ/TnpB family protein [Actinopolymorpha alba]|uniref:RNA-guided endonuclease InsQ/TnpB family protein n=1 Tax=Actinopolymorpha alba TaxID=533267 RepID=UPI00146D8732|nr:RNA-guided endonuclease TnpB family protein [Actinopolymorpha alba]
MILSRERAPRYGLGRLVVDGLDAAVCRKARFAFDPSPGQERGLLALLAACCEVYNAGLQERREAWRRANKSVSLFDQFTQIKGLRGLRDDVLAWGIQRSVGRCGGWMQAFAGFYRRVKAGRAPGYPRFRSRRRFHTASWDEPTSWKVNIDRRLLRIQGVGTIRLPKSAGRQLARLADRGGVPVTLSVTRRRAGGTSEHPKWVWRASVGFKDVTPLRAASPSDLGNGRESGAGRVVGADRGVAVALATSEGQLHVMPGWMGQARETIAALQRRQARKVKFSRSWRALARRIAREYRKVAQRTDNWARETARQLVAQAEVVALENLDLASMTRSAKGTIDNPGRNVAAKSGLNRALQDVALGRLATWVCVKAEEAGRRAWLVDLAHTSQRCARCGHIDPNNRPARDVFVCQRCGHTAHADLNAAANIADRGRACETAWHQAGSPPLPRPSPRLRRRRRTETARPRLAPA